MKNEIQEEKKMSVTQETTLFAANKSESSEVKRNSESFLQGLKSELKKVSWTSKKELISSTKIVVGSTFFLGMGIYVADLLIRQCLLGIHTLARLVFGA